ncbi:MAG: acyl-CoA dehydrogenase [Acidimicrobiia bacterium]
MRYMFTMMNQARLSVAVEGLAVAERAYQQTVGYAAKRLQGRAPGTPSGESSPIAAHPDVARMLLTMRAQIEAMRRLVYWNAAALDRARRHPDPVAAEEAADLAALLTPLSKAWCTDTGVDVASLGIQVHGGVGFIEETVAAQYLRDARITPIYEGTNGIQAIDLVTRKLGLKGGAVVKDHLVRLAALDADLAAAGPDLALTRASLAAGLEALARATGWLAEHADRPADVLAGATPYLRLMATVTAGWLMARSALAARAELAAGTGDAAAHCHRIVTARFFCEQLLPPATALVPAVTAGAAALVADR